MSPNLGNSKPRRVEQARSFSISRTKICFVRKHCSLFVARFRDFSSVPFYISFKPGQVPKQTYIIKIFYFHTPTEERDQYCKIWVAKAEAVVVSMHDTYLWSLHQIDMFANSFLWDKDAH